MKKHPSNLTYLPPYVEGKTYNNNGKYPSWRLPRHGQAAVYVIKEDNVVVYIGMSKSSSQRVVYRHFQSWSDHRQYRVTYKDLMEHHSYTLAVMLCKPRTAVIYERKWIIELQPRDNREKYEKFKHEAELRKNRKLKKKKEHEPEYDDVPF